MNLEKFKLSLADNMRIIAKSINHMDFETHDKLIDSIGMSLRNGGRIVISGLGKNVPIAEKFVGTLNSLGIPAAFMHTNTAIHGDLGMVNGYDSVILLSKSGNTRETIELAGYLEKRMSNKVGDIWLITFNENNKLKELVPNQLVFNIEHEGDKWDKVPHNSTSVYLIYLQELALAIANWYGTTEDINSVFYKNHPGGAIGESIKNE